jgi:hypothetical protein
MRTEGAWAAARKRELAACALLPWERRTVAQAYPCGQFLWNIPQGSLLVRHGPIAQEILRITWAMGGLWPHSPGDPTDHLGNGAPVACGPIAQEILRITWAMGRLWPHSPGDPTDHLGNGGMGAEWPNSPGDPFGSSGQ